MASEAAALGKLRRQPDLLVAVSGARPQQAEALARRLIAQQVDALLSWGIAGGLNPDLPSGALLIPGSVVDTDETVLPLVAVRMSGQDAKVSLAGVESVIATPAGKAGLRDRTGADAADMETHRVARVAAEAAIPCFAIRAISDTVHRALPPGTEDALDVEGRPRVLPVLMGLLRHPGRLPQLLAAKRDLDAALATLSSLGVELLQGVLEAPKAGCDSERMV